MDATLTKLTKQFSQKQYDRYVAQNIRAMAKARDNGHRDFLHWTDAEIRRKRSLPQSNSQRGLFSRSRCDNKNRNNPVLPRSVFLRSGAGPFPHPSGQERVLQWYVRI